MNDISANRIQFKKVKMGVLTVPCEINRDYIGKFLIDTGAAFSVISNKFAAETGLDHIQPEKYIRMMSVNSSLHTPVIKLGSLKIGLQEVSDIEALLISLPSELKIDGLIGINFLEKFRVTFEFDTSIIVLRSLRKNK